jgi:enolase
MTSTCRRFTHAGERVEKFNELVRIEEAGVSVKPLNFNTR